MEAQHSVWQVHYAICENENTHKHWYDITRELVTLHESISNNSNFATIIVQNITSITV